MIRGSRFTFGRRQGIISTMHALLLALGAGATLILAYITYGRWLSNKVFTLREDSETPAVSLSDGRDFCPTAKSVVFGHHFTSIAGTGPIVGPAIAVMWGWLPALIWVILGAIFLGAVHDLASLVISLRNRGRTIGDIAGDLLGPRVRLIFLAVLVMGLWVVLAVFGLVIASVLRQYPAAIFPVLFQIPLAVGIGLLVHRKGRSLALASAICLALMYASVVFGDASFGPTLGGLHSFNAFLAAQPLWAWTTALLLYCYVASVLPVWLLLQPRDYINALQLISALALIVAGLVGAAVLGGFGQGTDAHAPGAARQPLELVAPMIQWQPAGAPPILPMLFITIACGAISGFHCLVASGTTSKQVRCETHARAVGYGSMLTESFLAVLVIVACAAGIGLGLVKNGSLYHGVDAYQAQYQSWTSAGALASTIGAFVLGSANLIESIGIPHTVAIALMGVLVASFAGTTMDTACRLQRYVIQELGRAVFPRAAGDSHTPPIHPARWLTSTHGATSIAVASAALLAVIPPRGQPWTVDNAGKGGMILWPLFGATNQLLAGLAFVVIFAWLRATRRPRWFVAPPMVFMLIVPAWAMGWQAFVGNEHAPSWASTRSWTLLTVACATLALEAWLVAEALMWAMKPIAPHDAMQRARRAQKWTAG